MSILLCWSRCLLEPFDSFYVPGSPRRLPTCHWICPKRALAMYGCRAHYLALGADSPWFVMICWIWLGRMSPNIRWFAGRLEQISIIKRPFHAEFACTRPFGRPLSEILGCSGDLTVNMCLCRWYIVHTPDVGSALFSKLFFCLNCFQSADVTPEHLPNGIKIKVRRSKTSQHVNGIIFMLVCFFEICVNNTFVSLYPYTVYI